MKFRRFLSGLLFGLGCALSFIGLLTIVLPAIDNPQLQLVLASFEMSSEIAAVQFINRFMNFALQHSWRVLYLGLLILGVGAALLLHFTPIPQKRKKITTPPPSPMVTEVEKKEKPNPYANAVYCETVIPKDQPSAFTLPTQPILERNQIEKSEETYEECQPYFSPRFVTESRAIETEISAPSQSGSRLLIRSTYDPPQPHSPSEVSPPEPTVPAPVPEAKPTASSRIRSTMGRHTMGKSNLSGRHS